MILSHAIRTVRFHNFNSNVHPENSKGETGSVNLVDTNESEAR